MQAVDNFMPFDVTTLFSGSVSQVITWVVIVIVLKKNGINVFELLKNGKNGNGNGNKEMLNKLQGEITLLGENHIHTLSEKLDKLTEKEEMGNDISKQILFHMQELRRELKDKS